jgi:predicted nucleic acid-binding protein
MIAADTSTLVAYFNGDDGSDVERLVAAMVSGDLALPPVVVTEILSDPVSAPRIETEIRNLTQLDITDDYWLRAGWTRRTVVSHGLKARLGDALIAQSCLDHDVALIARDRDLRHFAEHCGLRLA